MFYILLKFNSEMDLTDYFDFRWFLKKVNRVFKIVWTIWNENKSNVWYVLTHLYSKYCLTDVTVRKKWPLRTLPKIKYNTYTFQFLSENRIQIEARYLLYIRSSGRHLLAMDMLIIDKFRVWNDVKYWFDLLEEACPLINC